MLLAGDDLEYTPHFLDNLYAKYVQEQDYKCMVYARYGRVRYVDETEKYAGMVVMGRSPFRWGNGLWSRQFFVELGGFDVRFTVGPYDCEMQCRAFNQGGRYAYAHDALLIEDCSLSPSTAWETRGGRWEMNNLRDARWFSDGDWNNGEFFTSPTTPFEPIGDAANACVQEIIVGLQ